MAQYSRTSSSYLSGVEAVPVSVECVVEKGIPSFRILGMEDSAAHESQSRVASAIRMCGFSMPRESVTVNVIPDSTASRPVAPSGMDLAIACAVLAASGQVDKGRLDGRMLLGELALDGSVRTPRGFLASLKLAAQREMALVTGPCSLPREGAWARFQAPSTGAGTLWVADTLGAAARGAEHMPGRADRPRFEAIDYATIYADDFAKRAICAAIAGGHSILMVGPDGSPGGELLAPAALRTVLPEAPFADAFASAIAHEAAGLEWEAAAFGTPAVRSPHCSASLAALIGGGKPIVPGEAALASGGVLVLGDLQEFAPGALKVVRAAVDEGSVRIARAEGAVEMPARFALAATAKPCPCGNFGNPRRECTDSAEQVAAYQERLDGPLGPLAFDMEVVLPAEPVSFAKRKGDPGLSSAEMRGLVEGALELRSEREGRQGHPDIPDAASLRFDAEAWDMLSTADLAGVVGPRALDSAMLVARTYADMSGHGHVKGEDLLAALSVTSRAHGADAIARASVPRPGAPAPQTPARQEEAVRVSAQQAERRRRQGRPRT